MKYGPIEYHPWISLNFLTVLHSLMAFSQAILWRKKRIKQNYKREKGRRKRKETKRSRAYSTIKLAKRNHLRQLESFDLSFVFSHLLLVFLKGWIRFELGGASLFGWFCEGEKKERRAGWFWLFDQFCSFGARGDTSPQFSSLYEGISSSFQADGVSC